MIVKQIPEIKEKRVLVYIFECRKWIKVLKPKYNQLGRNNYKIRYFQNKFINPHGIKTLNISRIIIEYERCTSTN